VPGGVDAALELIGTPPGDVLQRHLDKTSNGI